MTDKQRMAREEFAERQMYEHCKAHHLNVPNHIIKDAIRIGFDAGYYNGQLEFIEELRIKLKELHKFANEDDECDDMYYNGMHRGLDEVQGFLTDKECEITGIDKDELVSTEKEVKEEVEEQNYNFKPFDKVLVRDLDSENWECNIFSHIEGEYYLCVGGFYEQCIPYEGNEHLVGTADSPK